MISEKSKVIFSMIIFETPDGERLAQAIIENEPVPYFSVPPVPAEIFLMSIMHGITSFDFIGDCANSIPC